MTPLAEKSEMFEIWEDLPVHRESYLVYMYELCKFAIHPAVQETSPPEEIELATSRPIANGKLVRTELGGQALLS